MNRDAPETPRHNDDAFERSMRRRMGSAPGSGRGTSLSSIARRAQDSPLDSRTSSGRGPAPAAPAELTPSRPVSADEFEEWMRMVRNKRIKANNAFSVQLIDAFHSMVRSDSLSQHGGATTFQEASNTLGGCVTVYKNRIIRVKDDTTRLLSGVTDKRAQEADPEDAEGDEGDAEDEDGNESAKKRKFREALRRKRATDGFLLPARKLMIDMDELKLAIDPLLRKMSAEFDNRGSSSLLQYSVRPNRLGRLTLDAESEEEDINRVQLQTMPRQAVPVKPEFMTEGRMPAIVEEDEEQEPEQESKEEEEEDRDKEDTSGMAARLAQYNIAYFQGFDSRKEVLPHANSIVRALEDPREGTEKLLQKMRGWDLADPENLSTYDEEQGLNVEGPLAGEGLGDDEDQDNNDYYDGDVGLADLAPDLANELSLDDVPNNDGDTGNASMLSIVSTQLPADGNWQDIDYLQQLDKQQRNWGGASNWKLRRLDVRRADMQGASATSRTRREAASAPQEIDFNAQPPDLAMLFAKNRKRKQLTKKQWQLTYLAPPDMQVSTREMLQLSLRPLDTDIAYAFRKGGWRAPKNQRRQSMHEAGPEDAQHPSFVNESYYDDNGFDKGFDDGFHEAPVVDNQDFFDKWKPTEPVRELVLPATQTQQPYSMFGGGLQYARVAKRVDVRKLKNYVWQSIAHTLGTFGEPTTTSREDAQDDTDSIEEALEPATPQEEPLEQTSDGVEPKEASLKHIIHETQPRYGEAQRADLSPAMYFISLLHLANEHGLTLESTEDLSDVRIKA